METLEILRRKIKSAQDLYSVVRTMRALASVNIRQYQRAVASLVEYGRTVELGFRILVKHHPELMPESQARPAGRPVLVVLGSDRGMCGPFNERMARHCLEELGELGIEPAMAVVLAVGVRLRNPLESLGIKVSHSYDLPSSAQAITAAVQEVMLQIESLWASHEPGRLLVLHQRPLHAAAYQPHTTHLLPLNLRWLRRIAHQPWPTQVIPSYAADPVGLFRALVRQYLLVSLHRAFAESLASENAARLASMQVAQKNIEQRGDELRRSYHQQRQQQVTEELLDIVAGFEALASQRG